MFHVKQFQGSTPCVSIGNSAEEQTTIPKRKGEKNNERKNGYTFNESHSSKGSYG